MKSKSDPARYTLEELAYFREERWVSQRWRIQPAECNGGPNCWVEEGPPAYERLTTRGKCLGCGGSPANPQPLHGNMHSYRRKP